VKTIQCAVLYRKVQQDSYRCVRGPVTYVSGSSMLATLCWNIPRKALKPSGISRPFDLLYWQLPTSRAVVPAIPPSVGCVITGGHVECCNCLGSMITNDGRCTWEIISSIATAKASFNRSRLFSAINWN